MFVNMNIDNSVWFTLNYLYNQTVNMNIDNSVCFTLKYLYDQTVNMNIDKRKEATRLLHVPHNLNFKFQQNLELLSILSSRG
jgi:hypothetical protein